MLTIYNPCVKSTQEIKNYCCQMKSDFRVFIDCTRTEKFVYDLNMTKEKATKKKGCWSEWGFHLTATIYSSCLQNRKIFKL